METTFGRKGVSGRKPSSQYVDQICVRYEYRYTNICVNVSMVVPPGLGFWIAGRPPVFYSPKCNMGAPSSLASNRNRNRK